MQPVGKSRQPKDLLERILRQRQFRFFTFKPKSSNILLQFLFLVESIFFDLTSMKPVKILFKNLIRISC